MAFTAAPAGSIVLDVWESLPKRFPTIRLDAFVVMPNHIHGIVFLGGNPVTDGTIVRGVQSSVSSVSSVASPFMATDALARDLPRTTTPPGEKDAMNGDATTSSRSGKRQPPVPPPRDPVAPALGEIIRSLKAASTTRIRKEVDPLFAWQEGYWDRIIRNDAELERYRSYIENNPARWEEDKEYLKGDW